MIFYKTLILVLLIKSISTKASPGIKSVLNDKPVCFIKLTKMFISEFSHEFSLSIF